MTAITAILRTVPGFSTLDGGSLDHIAAGATLAEVTPGEILFRERALPRSLYVLLEGRVSLTGTATDAASTVIDILEPGSNFVLANVLMAEPYQMGATAVTSSLVVDIGAAPIRRVVNDRPAAALAMIRAMSAELGNMTRQVVDLKVRIAAERLGTYLLGQVKDSTATTAEFLLPVPKGLLAPFLGCRAENLSRAFMTLRAYGVETHGSRVLLHDIPSLRNYAGVFEPIATEGDAARKESVEKVFGDAFRIWPRRSRDR